MHIASTDEEDFFSIAAFRGNLTVAWKLGPGHGKARRLRKEHAEDDWTTIKVQIKDTVLQAHFLQDEWSEESQSPGIHELNEPDFPVDAWYQLVSLGTVILGAGPSISIAPSSSLGESYFHQ